LLSSKAAVLAWAAFVLAAVGGLTRTPAQDFHTPALEDIHQKLFLEHKRRFEAWQDAQGDDDGW